MKVGKVLLVEDEKQHLENALEMLEDLGFTEIHHTDNAQDAITLLLDHSPQVAILDIGLKGNKSGLQLANEIKQLQPIPIIFATSFDQDQIIEKASSMAPVAYLVKPLAKPNLKAALHLAFSQTHREVSSLSGHQAIEKEAQGKDDFVFVKTTMGRKKVQFNNIDYVEIDGNRYCRVYVKGKGYRMRSTLGDLLTKLPEEQFVRIHRAHFINLHQLEQINEVDNWVLVNGVELDIGKAYRKDFLERLSYL